jgi:hypothetical protein
MQDETQKWAALVYSCVWHPRERRASLLFRRGNFAQSLERREYFVYVWVLAPTIEKRSGAGAAVESGSKIR